VKFPRTLEDGFTLRAVRTDADAEKVIDLNAQVHGPDEGEAVRYWLFEGHPKMRREDWLFVEDEEQRQTAATLCLMATTWKYGVQPLPVAELGFVATHPDYRRRGLQRLLSDAFDELALDQGYTLAAIEGIPGFYGQFGYEYAVPLIGGFDLDYDRVPEGAQLKDIGGVYAGDGYRLRRAQPADVPLLQPLYDGMIADLDIAALRDREMWTYQVAAPEDLAFYPPTTVIEHAGQTVGYIRWTDDDWTEQLRILELAVRDGPGVWERISIALRFARDRGMGAGKRGLTLQLPDNHPAVKLARYLSPGEASYYAWQMKVLEVGRFMHAIRSALEARVEGSLLAGYSGVLVFQLYRSRLVLEFDRGLLVNITTPDQVENADARMSLKQATQLWLGWRGRQALEGWYPDFSTKDSSRQLLDILFPQAMAYIYLPY
jgi:predicted N-acetyltransferase YhbS